MATGFLDSRGAARLVGLIKENLKGERGESVVACGPNAPEKALEGDAWLVQDEGGKPLETRIYHDHELYPSDDLYPDDDLFPMDSGWNTVANKR